MDPTPVNPVEALLAPGAPPFSVITGTAGTGKTRAIVEASYADPSLLLTATTGIAAVNLGDGQTINAALGYFDTDSLREAFLAGWLHTRIRRLMDQGIRRILLDEMSMLAAEQLDLIVPAILQVADGNPAKTLGLTLVGDFCQLPPVKAAFAFTAASWAHFALNTVVLTHVYRQSDLAFISALQSLRRGQAPDRVIDILEGCFKPTTNLEFDGTTLVARNEEVDRINKLRYGLLPGEEILWPSHRWGEQRSEWTKWIPPFIGVKPDTLVMLLANRPLYSGDELIGYRYINGDLGHVVDCGEVETTVAGLPLIHEPMRVKLLRTGETVDVDYVTRQVLDPNDTVKTKKARKVIGEIMYLPVRHAYATTVHKAQGLTFDTVQVSIRDHFWATPAMMYVALSRCRTVEGLRVVGTPQMIVNKTKVDPRVKAWV